MLRFSKRAASLYRRIAGRRVEVECATVTPSGGGLVADGGGVIVMRAPRRGRRLRTGSLSRVDYCSVSLRRHRELIAIAPVTARGRTYIDEKRTVALLLLPEELGDSDDPGPPPAALVVERGRGAVVALDGPDGTPPGGKLGYWTDGVRAVSVAVTKAGRRLFFERERDVVRTNVLPYLFDD